jgi:hypothetical protein
VKSGRKGRLGGSEDIRQVLDAVLDSAHPAGATKKAPRRSRSETIFSHMMVHMMVGRHLMSDGGRIGRPIGNGLITRPSRARARKVRAR